MSLKGHHDLLTGSPHSSPRPSLTIRYPQSKEQFSERSGATLYNLPRACGSSLMSHYLFSQGCALRCHPSGSVPTLFLHPAGPHVRSPCWHFMPFVSGLHVTILPRCPSHSGPLPLCSPALSRKDEPSFFTPPSPVLSYICVSSPMSFLTQQPRLGCLLNLRTQSTVLLMHSIRKSEQINPEFKGQRLGLPISC